MSYAIKNKATGELFSGFDAAGDPIWTIDRSRAWSRDRITTEAQAALFIRHGIPAQRKVIAA